MRGTKWQAKGVEGVKGLGRGRAVPGGLYGNPFMHSLQGRAGQGTQLEYKGLSDHVEDGVSFLDIELPGRVLVTCSLAPRIHSE